MTSIHRTYPFDAPKDRPILPEASWPNRREFVRAVGLGGAMLAAGPLAACQGGAQDGTEESPLTTYPPSDRWVPRWPVVGGKAAYPAKRNEAFHVRRSLNPEDDAASQNNFYEFLPGRAGPVHRFVGDFEPRPWKITIAGEVEKERTVDLDDLAKVAPLEERVYHFRCVERWSMVVPWTGIPLARFIEWCRPKSTAKHVRFVSFGPKDLDETQRAHMPPGFKDAPNYPWPYYEGLRMDEATNELAFLATGIYGHGLPMQHGAPLRVLVPWKYGYKNPKSFVRIEFTREQPHTFWNDLQASEYPYLSNIDPAKPHPRWSQAREWDITTKDWMPTLKYNGYGESVAKLYGG